MQPTKVSRFEDLIAWQKARALTQNIYRITNSPEFSKDYGLRDQIRRASVSMMSNIAEGFERNSPGDFARFLAIAKASCGEVRCQLYVALDVGYITTDIFDKLFDQVVEVSKIIGGLKTSVERNR